MDTLRNRGWVVEKQGVRAGEGITVRARLGWGSRTIGLQPPGGGLGGAPVWPGGSEALGCGVPSVLPVSPVDGSLWDDGHSCAPPGVVTAHSGLEKPGGVAWQGPGMGTAWGGGGPAPTAALPCLRKKMEGEEAGGGQDAPLGELGTQLPVATRGQHCPGGRLLPLRLMGLQAPAAALLCLDFRK